MMSASLTNKATWSADSHIIERMFAKHVTLFLIEIKESLNGLKLSSIVILLAYNESVLITYNKCFWKTADQLFVNILCIRLYCIYSSLGRIHRIRPRLIKIILSIHANKIVSIYVSRYKREHCHYKIDSDKKNNSSTLINRLVLTWKCGNSIFSTAWSGFEQRKAQSSELQAPWIPSQLPSNAEGV